MASLAAADMAGTAMIAIGVVGGLMAVLVVTEVIIMTAPMMTIKGVDMMKIIQLAARGILGLHPQGQQDAV